MGGGLGGLGGGSEMPFNAEINVTSLVDVAFVLLIIFMITAPIMQGGVDVELPRAEARPLTAKEGMVVTVDRSGRIFVDETPITYNDFRVTFRSLVTTRKPTGVYLRADSRVAYGDVVRTLAVIRAAGVRTWGSWRRKRSRRGDEGAAAARSDSGKTVGFLGTVVVHAAAGFFFLSVIKTPPPSPPVYAVNLVAAPAPAPKQRLAPEATPTPPAPEPPAPAKTTKTAPIRRCR